MLSPYTCIARKPNNILRHVNRNSAVVVPQTLIGVRNDVFAEPELVEERNLFATGVDHRSQLQEFRRHHLHRILCSDASGRIISLRLLLRQQGQ